MDAAIAIASSEALAGSSFPRAFIAATPSRTGTPRFFAIVACLALDSGFIAQYPSQSRAACSVAGKVSATVKTAPSFV